jgi:signal peptidase II
MKRQDWVVVGAPLFLILLLDQVSKYWATSIEGLNFWGPLGITYHETADILYGPFSQLPPFLRVVSLSTGGIFVLVSFLVMHYLLPIKSMTIRSGSSLLVGGILGNVIDRVIHGKITNFLMIGWEGYTSPPFNFADISQWVGYVTIVYALFREREVLWPKENARRSYWINPLFQIKYCVILVLVGTGFALVSGTYSYTYLRITILDLVGHNERLLDQFLLPFVMTFLVIYAALAALLFLIGRVLSHQIAGPIYALERFFDDVKEHKYRSFSMRSKDDLHHLKDLANKISQELQRFHSLQQEYPHIYQKILTKGTPELPQATVAEDEIPPVIIIDEGEAT